MYIFYNEHTIVKIQNNELLKKSKKRVIIMYAGYEESAPEYAKKINNSAVWIHYVVEME